jgi:microcystin-dependent protein
MKKIAILTSSAVLFVSSFVPAMATTTVNGNSCTNSTTGPLSENSCTIKNESKVEVKNVNDAVIKNDVTAISNTGGNEASMNTLGGKIVTGDAKLSSTVSNVANVNTTYVKGGPAASSNVGGNEITGPGSTNRVWLLNEQKVDVYNSNTASVDNNVETSANTGRNLANMNTGPASVTAGDALLGVTVGTHVNDNLTDITAGAGGTGGNFAENATTGPLSKNSVTIRNRAKAEVDNVNDMVVKNNVQALANSGDNQAKQNTLGGDITTGGAKTGVGVDTEGNLNDTKVIQAMGGFANQGSNSVTGPGMGDSVYDPLIDITNEQDIVVENWNNKCKSHNADRLGENDKSSFLNWWNRERCDVSDIGVFNDIEAGSVTGENKANTNTGGGDVLAGMSELLQSVLVHMNDTLTTIQQ